jgi:hypothetical protein
VGFWRLLLREVYLTLMPKQVKRSRSFLIDVTKGLAAEWDGGMWDLPYVSILGRQFYYGVECIASHYEVSRS